MVRLLVYKPGKETVIVRKANKTHDCDECHGLIPKGFYYVEDRLNYLQRKHGGGVFKWHHRHKVCSICWLGPVPENGRQELASSRREMWRIILGKAS